MVYGLPLSRCTARLAPGTQPSKALGMRRAGPVDLRERRTGSGLAANGPGATRWDCPLPFPARRITPRWLCSLLLVRADLREGGGHQRHCPVRQGAFPSLSTSNLTLLCQCSVF